MRTGFKPDSVGPGFKRDHESRILEVDGLRGLAIALVLFYHFFGATVPYHPRSVISYLFAPTRLSWSGVDLFFVLSGFLIGGILLDAKRSTNYFKVFYTRRFFRIVPIYVVLLLSFVALHLAASNSQTSFSLIFQGAMPMWTYPLFIQNFWVAAAGVFGTGWLAPTWSLAVEEQFYLTLPSIVRFFSRRVLIAFVICGIAAAPAFRMLWFRSSPNGWLGSQVLLFCRADALLFGVACALLIRSRTWSQRLANSRYLFPALLLALFGLAAYLTKFHASFWDLGLVLFGYTGLAALYACLLLFVCTRPAHLLASVFRWRVLRWLGSIAYGAYLFHMPVQALAFALIRRTEPRIENLPTLLLSFVALGLSLALAHLSWNFFESPLVKFSHRARYEFQPEEERSISVTVPAGARQ